MKLFIATGGKGKRLGELTKDLPKPLVPVAGKPVLHHIVDWAKKNPINEIVMLNGYKADKIVEYFEDGSKFGIKIVHSNEPHPLDSGGAIKFAEKHIDSQFAYISGDHICEVNLNKMIGFHKNNISDMTVLVHKSTHPWDADILQINNNNEIVKFVSKHDDHTNAGDLSNSGLSIIEPKILDLMDKEIFNFENYLYPKMLERKMKLMAYVTNEFMADMGTLERLRKCEEHLLSRQRNHN